MTTGVIIGSFYPPHKGHRFLIETALGKVDALIVVVCQKEGQQISGDLRATWLREIVPGVNIIVIDDIFPEDDFKARTDYIIKTLGFDPDYVFTSKYLGDLYSKYLGSKHVIVDRDRKWGSISATQIGTNPLNYWEYLDLPVKAYFARKICVLGAESTDTKTLTRALSSHYQTNFAPGFGNLYLEASMESWKGKGFSTGEFNFIAQEQNRIEDQLARSCNKILICDIGSFVMCLGQKWCIGSTQTLRQGMQYDLYLLNDISMSFAHGWTRDGDRHIREMHKRFIEELKSRKKPFMLLNGSHDIKVKKSIEACDRILNEIRPII